MVVTAANGSSDGKSKLIHNLYAIVKRTTGWLSIYENCCMVSNDFPSNFFSGDEALAGALTSGEWYVDNNQSTEQQALSQRVNSRDPSYRGNIASTGGMESTAGGGAGNVEGGSSESGRQNQKAPRLLPIKSFQNDLASISVRCYSRCRMRLFGADW